MVEIPKKNQSVYAEAGTLLAAAIAQLSQVNKALAVNRNGQLESASERARDAVSQIRNAMRSGNLDSSALASLSAALSIGVDASALAVEAAQDSRTVAVKVQLAAASIESHATVEQLSDDMFRKHIFVMRTWSGTRTERNWRLSRDARRETKNTFASSLDGIRPKAT